MRVNPAIFYGRRATGKKAWSVMKMHSEKTTHVYAYCCGNCDLPHEFGEKCPMLKP